jgi:2-polyprenyl-3-methyl-5-hydroxy-6-metoxy-1,4-benzoquinol methylase
MEKKEQTYELQRMNDIYEDKSPSYYIHSRPELHAFIPKPVKTALDVGCGSGNFGHTLKELYNCEVWGIEPNKEAAIEAGKKIDKSINSIFTDNMPELTGKKFDIIFFNDVLEHLADPENALIACKKLLTKNGHIVASIPNVRWYPVILSLLRYKDFKYELSGVMDKTHLRFFTLKSIHRLFEDSGYKVITAEGINKDNNFTFFNILNFMLFNTQWDMKFKQFVIVANIADHAC